MDNEVVEQILTRIDGMGDLSMQAFDIIVQQAVVEAVSRSIWAVVWLVLAVVALVFARKFFSRGDLDDFDVGWGIACSITSLVLTLISAIMITSAVKWFINPEFYAIKWILESF